MCICKRHSEIFAVTPRQIVSDHPRLYDPQQHLIFRKNLSRTPITPNKPAMAARPFKDEFACAQNIAAPTPPVTGVSRIRSSLIADVDPGRVRHTPVKLAPNRRRRNAADYFFKIEN
jgi:hypothetical protein